MSGTIEEYLQLPYTIEVMRDDSGEQPGWFAKVLELPGCMTQVNSFEELQTMIEDAMYAWILTALEDGIPIPTPRSDEAYSGRFVVRLPRSLHRQLATAAQREGISLNSYVNVALAQAVVHASN
ncbi:MAG: toxin-antitoxin system HicB family antitoxin [Anaerolinea sp.]|nr:toxin-antitoxin system HicB family antitoxin [Anaerolinea sp.]